MTIKYSSYNIKTKLRNKKIGFHNKHLTTKKDYKKGAETVREKEVKDIRNVIRRMPKGEAHRWVPSLGIA